MSIDIDVILYICGAISAISAATAIVIKFMKKSISKISKDVSNQVIQQHEQEILSKLQDLSNKVDKSIRDRKDSDIIQKEALISLACARINESYGFFMKRGSISPYALSILEEVLESYKNLGGNHLAESQIEELRKLRKDTDAMSQAVGVERIHHQKNG